MQCQLLLLLMLDLPFLFTFLRQVHCSTVVVVRKHRISLVRRKPRLNSRERDTGHHRPVMASAPDRRNWWWGGGGQNFSHT